MLGETVIFRATDELAGAIQQKAHDAGMNVSEYLRAILGDTLANVAAEDREGVQ